MLTFRFLDLITSVGIILVVISMIFASLKVRTWVVPFTAITGSILLLAGQLLLVILFKTIRSCGRYHLMEYTTVRNVPDACFVYFSWIIILGLIVYATIKSYLER